MDKNSLWSLRLGFSGKQASTIEAEGIQKFLSDSFQSKFDTGIPEALKDEPKTMRELRTYRQNYQNASTREKQELNRSRRQTTVALRKWWIDKMREDEFPLREKMVVFWHNHFVSTVQKVRVSHWVYQHNMILRAHAFGNFKELCKKVLKSNAMVRYLDNVDNRRGKINENLSRELLELFTLGIGNYTEADIKNGAKGLAGLNIGEQGAVYRRFQQDDDVITYFGKQGRFKADDMVDIIFEQPEIPYRITRKILQWFVLDNPTDEQVRYYGDYFRSMGFEIQPLLLKIFTEEFQKENAGSKIKDPLVYTLQLFEELNIKEVDSTVIAFFLQQQGMDLFNQPNVKGWDGGRSWLTPQILLQRNNVSDMVCRGKMLNRGRQGAMQGQRRLKDIDVKLNWTADKDNHKVIKELTDRLLFQVDDQLMSDLENMLKYDFNPQSENADQVVLRLFNFITKTPEFQLI